jgi:hypothetical protein
MRTSTYIKTLLCSAAFVAGFVGVVQNSVHAGFEFFPSPEVVAPKPDPVMAPLPTLSAAPLPQASVPSIPAVPPVISNTGTLQHKDFVAPQAAQSIVQPPPVAAPVFTSSALPAPSTSEVTQSNPAMEMIRNDLARGMSASNSMTRPQYGLNVPVVAVQNSRTLPMPQASQVQVQQIPAQQMRAPKIQNTAPPLPVINVAPLPSLNQPPVFEAPVPVIRRGQIRDPQMQAQPVFVPSAAPFSRAEPVFERAPRRQRPTQPNVSIDVTNPAVFDRSVPLPVFEASPLPAAASPLELRVQDKKLVKDQISGRKIVKINPFPRTDLIDGGLPVPAAPIDITQPQERPASPIAIEDDKMARSSFVPAPVPVTRQALDSLHPAPSFEMVSGFGSDLSLAIALQQIIPPSYAYSFTSGVNPGMKVSWNGEKPWNVILDEMLAPLNLRAEIRGKTVRITS